MYNKVVVKFIYIQNKLFNTVHTPAFLAADLTCISCFMLLLSDIPAVNQMTAGPVCVTSGDNNPPPSQHPKLDQVFKTVTINNTKFLVYVMGGFLCRHFHWNALLPDFPAISTLYTQTVVLGDLIPERG